MRCVSNVGDFVEDEECNMKLRPSDSENCDMGACAKSWFLTEWGNRVGVPLDWEHTRLPLQSLVLFGVCCVLYIQTSY